jgi:uncharacterized protein YebE (UPF0316 family)
VQEVVVAYSVVSAGSMCLLAMVSVGLWTLRVALAARGRRVIGAAVAAAEALVFAVVFSSLVTDLGSWDRLVGYATGVAVGTVLGLVANDRLNPGAAIVEVVVSGEGADLSHAFFSRGWPATAMPAVGIHGAATVLFLAVQAQRVGEVLDVIRLTAPDASWTTRPATTVHASSGMTAPVPVAP